MNNTIHDTIKQYILDNVPGTKVVSGFREITTRCIFCGDSRDKGSAHLYIGPFDNIEDHPIFYHCMRCNEAGIVDSPLLQKLSLSNTELSTLVVKYNKSIRANPSNRFNKKTKSYFLKNDYISDDSSSRLKLQYINDRLGVNISFADILNLKIVLNLGDVLQCNNITEFTRYHSVVDELDKYFVGFISINNNFITLRNLEIAKVSDGINRRYTDYNVFGDRDSNGRFYTIPTNINIWSNTPVHLFVAEGVFDILSLYLNTDNIKENAIYCACLGKASYINAIRYFISTLGVINCVIHLCIDNDMNEYSLYNLLEIINGLNVNTFVHRNIFDGEKDFGVPKDRINESITQHIKIIV